VEGAIENGEFRPRQPAGREGNLRGGDAPRSRGAFFSEDVEIMYVDNIAQRMSMQRQGYLSVGAG
jgi:hypothetical protein